MTYGLTEAEMFDLSRYNGERAHGLVHTEEWRETMRLLQERYDAGIAADPQVILVPPKDAP